MKITIDRERGEATVDFTGTSLMERNNLNAPKPVTRAAVLYVFRVMVEAQISMNAGCPRPIRIIVPDGCMLAPKYPAAVVTGNVETSQHVTNRLFGALGALSNSEGTMNNLAARGGCVAAMVRHGLSASLWRWISRYYPLAARILRIDCPSTVGLMVIRAHLRPPGRRMSAKQKGRVEDL